MQASPFYCRLTHHPTLALHQEKCLFATRGKCTFKCPYQLLHSYLNPRISSSRISPFDRTQTYASSACWMTYLFFWTVTCDHLLSLYVPHIQPVPNPVLFPCFFSFTHIIAPKSQLSAPFTFGFFGFPTVLLFFPLLTPIPFTCSCQISIKTLLTSDSQLLDNHSLIGKVYIFGVTLKAYNIWFQPQFPVSPPLFRSCCQLHAWQCLALPYFLRLPLASSLLPQSWKQCFSPSLFTLITQGQSWGTVISAPPKSEWIIFSLVPYFHCILSIDFKGL